MVEHSDAALYRTYIDRLLEGDVDRIAPLLAEAVVWHEPGGAEPIIGRQPLLEQMRWVTSALKVEIDIHDVVASDQHVVALIEFRVAAAARSLASRQVEIWHVRDDQVTERWLFVDDFQGLAEFFTGVGEG